MNLFLFLHIIGAVMSLVAILISMGLLIGKSGKLRLMIPTLIVSASFQVITGIGLFLSSPAASLQRSCISGFLYLAVMTGVVMLVQRSVTKEIK